MFVGNESGKGVENVEGEGESECGIPMEGIGDTGIGNSWGTRRCVVRVIWLQCRRNMKESRVYTISQTIVVQISLRCITLVNL